MTKYLVEVTDDQAERLIRLAAAQRCSVTEAIVTAIEEYVTNRSLTPASAKDAFGLWQGRDIDGLEYQRRARSDW